MIFNHAIFGRSQGKQMFLVSNTVDNIDNYSYYTQAMYNRALAQLGINAFIEGNLYDVQHSLSDLCGNMRTKELLAQGFQKQEQQVQQRKRIFPYYLHLNIDMIESIELIASMLNETPYIFKDGGRITSKTFKRIY
jgi:translation initiation factor 3 subunit C